MCLTILIWTCMSLPKCARSWASAFMCLRLHLSMSIDLWVSMWLSMCVKVHWRMCDWLQRSVKEKSIIIHHNQPLCIPSGQMRSWPGHSEKRLTGGWNVMFTNLTSFCVRHFQLCWELGKQVTVPLKICSYWHSKAFFPHFFYGKHILHFWKCYFGHLATWERVLDMALPENSAFFITQHPYTPFTPGIKMSDGMSLCIVMLKVN